jgi:hypothetical protein
MLWSFSGGQNKLQTGLSLWGKVMLPEGKAKANRQFQIYPPSATTHELRCVTRNNSMIGIQ